RRDRRVNSPLLVVACTLWILSTIRMFIDIERTVEAFVNHIETPTGPEEFLSDLAGPVSLLDNTIYGVQTLIGDAVVIYRCYIVWDRFDVIILPGMAWLAMVRLTLFMSSIGTIIFILNSFAHGTISGNKILLVYAMTLAANLSVTCLLAFRIWQADRAARKRNSSVDLVIRSRKVRHTATPPGAMQHMCVRNSSVKNVSRDNSGCTSKRLNGEKLEPKFGFGIKFGN
ncbi:hypothetical protein B0H11DRAFT_1727028, partial [Mycena galericulata]